MRKFERGCLKSIALLGAMVLLGGGVTVSAQVTGSAPATNAGTGDTDVTVPYSVSVVDQGDIDGINGIFTYDTALLSNPRVETAAGSAGYLAESNEPTAGTVHFVLYENPPTNALDLSQPVLNFKFDVLGNIAGNPIATCNFTTAAAARVVDPTTVVSLGVGGGQAINFGDIVINIDGVDPPVIVSHPVSQGVREGDDVTFTVAATGDAQPFSYLWAKDTVDLPTQTNASINLTAVTGTSAGSYVAKVSNTASQTTNSNAAILSVLPANEPNSALAVGDTVPNEMLPNQMAPFTVTFQNDSNLSWTKAQGYEAQVISDPQNFIGVGTVLSLADADIITANGGVAAFGGTVNSQAGNSGDIQFQMNEVGNGLFGQVLTASITIGSDFTIDFANNSEGWISGVLLGTGATFVDGSGLCMTAPLTGDNIIGWLSPERLVPLQMETAFRMRVNASSSQSDVANIDTIPLWSMVYDNFNSVGLGFGNNYGGEAIFIDQATEEFGAANGIGRVMGRTSFEMWAAPNAALLPQWNGVIDTANSAFTPTADTFNDMRLTFRILDLDSAGILAENDLGDVCIGSLTVSSHPFASMSFTPEFTDPINSAFFAPQTLAQAAEVPTGTASIDDGNGLVNYQLTEGIDDPNTAGVDESAGGFRKTLIPFDPTTPGTFRAQLFPIQWDSDELFRSLAGVQSTSNAAEGDPVDTIFINADTATTELVTAAVTLRGSPPDNMFLAASPRSAATAGGPQNYIAFFYSHNTTAVSLVNVPDSDKFRFQADFFNVPAVGVDGTGTDPFQVTNFTADLVTLP